MTQINEEEFFAAIDLIAEEKKLSKEKVLETIEAALAVAYRKDYGRPQMEIKAKMGPGGLDGIKFWIVKEVIADDEEIKDELTQVHLKNAKKIDKEVEVEGKIYLEAPAPEDFGRIAAQTAKQVIIQRVREAEREALFNIFKDREGELVSAQVQRVEESGAVLLDVERTTVILERRYQIPGESFYNGTDSIEIQVLQRTCSV